MVLPYLEEFNMILFPLRSLLVSHSAAKVKVLVEECNWFRFTGSRSVKAENKEYDLEIATNNVYGIKPLARNKFAVLHKALTSEVFILDAKEARSLMGRSKPYKGKIDGKSVTTTTSNTPEGRIPHTEPQAVTYEVDPDSNSEDKNLTAMLHSSSNSKLKRCKFSSRSVLRTGEIYNVYEIRDFYDSLKSKTEWEAKAEDVAIAAIDGDYLIGAAMEKIAGVNTPILMIVE